jgi:4-amino-4-deoxy-L-arabinose transferase-like glycosyltransferase
MAKHAQKDMVSYIRRNLDLVIVLMLSGIGMIYFGSIAYIEYDGWWHVFVSREDIFLRFWRDVYVNAHPPIFYLLLKAASLLGNSRLLYRSVSIVSAIVAVVFIVLIVRRIAKNREIGIICGLAFGLSISTVIVANEVRSYMLSIAFILWGFYCFLHLVHPDPGPRHLRSRFGFMIATCFAVLTHYSSVFFVLASIATPFLLFVFSTDYRRSLKSSFQTRWRADIVTLSPAIMLATVAYLFHMSRYSGPMNYMPQFYYSKSEPLVAYIWNSVKLELALFSPGAFSETDSVWYVVGFAFVMTGLMIFFFLLRKEQNAAVAATPAVLFLSLTVSLLAASIFGKYPFGGHLRHQYVIFPFGIISIFMLFDRIIFHFRSRGAKLALTALLIIGIVANAIVQWKAYPIIREELFTREFNLFKASFPAIRAVYLDQFNLIAFFAHTQEWNWRFDRSITIGKIDLLWVEKNGYRFAVFRDLSRWNAQMDDPELFADIKTALEKTGLDSLAIFYLNQEKLEAPAYLQAEKESVAFTLRKLGSENNLINKKLEFDGHNIYALFSSDSGERKNPVWSDKQ